MYCVHEELFVWLRQLGFKKVHPLRLNKAVQVGDFSVTPLRALDRDVDSIFQIEVQDLRILNVVDSWIDDDVMDYLERAKPWDLVLWPFQTMNELEVIAPSRFPRGKPEFPAEWLGQLQRLAPKAVVPSSCQFIHETWSWYRYAYFPISYKYFTQEIQRILPDCKVMRINPGETFQISQGKWVPEPPIAWITPVGEQNLDYEFDPQRPPMSTAEIAAHLPSLTTEQAHLVRQYCELGLLQKFAALDETQGYFSKARDWQLSLYEGSGERTDYFYSIQEKQIQRKTSEETRELAWTTELPAYKLYSALTTGESLSSLYLRVNEQKFSEAVEAEVDEADILEDPLLRCLFNQDFGSYQKAQLERLLASAY